MSITRINEFQAAAGESENLFIFLKSLIPYISGSEGCISCEVLRNASASDSFVVIEKWDSIESHQKSVALVPKEKFQEAMKLFGAPPKGNYYHD
jgi:heme oxygenase (mycobilin-producing)